MNVWTVEFEERWTYDKKGMYRWEGRVYRVTARTSEQAIAKAKKLADIGRVYKDDEDGSDFWLEDVRLRGLVRGDPIDA